jgi:hypothetical protein
MVSLKMSFEIAYTVVRWPEKRRIEAEIDPKNLVR